MKRFILAITGASGACYAKKLFDVLKDNSELHVIVSERGVELLNLELDLKTSYFSGDNVTLYKNSKINTCIASGSFKTDGMVVVPASMGTIGRIASGVSTTMVERAADVILKEKRKLILVPRDTPYSLIHINNMHTITMAGGIICPASPSFYSNPSDFEELAATVADRILDLCGFEIESFRWNG